MDAAARTACGLGARQDGAAGDVSARPDEAVVALALGKGRLGSVAINTCHGHRQVLK